MSKTDAQGSYGSQVVPGEERRRSQRVMIRVPITIKFTTDGGEVTMQATTASVNDQGAMLVCSRSIATDTKLQIENQRTHQKHICRIVRASIDSADGYLVPVEFVGPAPGFWGISFPATNWNPPDD